MHNREVTVLIAGMIILSAFVATAVGLEFTGHRQLSYMVTAMGWSIELLFTMFAWVLFKLSGAR